VITSQAGQHHLGQRDHGVSNQEMNMWQERIRKSAQDPHPFHCDRRQHASDAERVLLLKAESELRQIVVIADHVDMSELGLRRIADAVRVIADALDLKRRKIGLQTGFERDRLYEIACGLDGC
jgi:hypothetical protein